MNKNEIGREYQKALVFDSQFAPLTRIRPSRKRGMIVVETFIEKDNDIFELDDKIRVEANLLLKSLCNCFYLEQMQSLTTSSKQAVKVLHYVSNVMVYVSVVDYRKGSLFKFVLDKNFIDHANSDGQNCFVKNLAAMAS